MYSFKKTESYRDAMLGDVRLREDSNGDWHEVGEKPRLTIKAEKGSIIATGRNENEIARILRFNPKTGKLDSFHITDPKSKIDVEVSISDEEGWMREFREQIKKGEKEPEYDKCKMEKTSWGWAFDDGKRKIRIGIDEGENEVWVIGSRISSSGERVDTKIFNLQNELLSFDSATENGAPGKVNVKKEEDEMGKFLYLTTVKLREKALEQNEFKTRGMT